jgi:hypothetical protein
MTLITRRSKVLEKASRRLVLLKSIDENLDLGNGLSVADYSQAIDAISDQLDSHNTLVSDIEISRQTLNQMDKNLSALSERMLNAVAAKYGKNSNEYVRAGGSNRKRSKSSIAPTLTTATAEPIVLAKPEPVKASTNGKVKDLVTV